MSLRNEFQNRVRIVRDASKPGERRLFAALELICAPLSFLTLFLFLPTLIFLERFHVPGPCWLAGLDGALRVLLAASVGYLTNFIALEMIFKPFRPNARHPLAILTFGYWKQGLVPRNKNRLGEEIGLQVEEKLLDARQISAEICETTVEFLQKPEIVTQTQTKMQTILKTHQGEIAAFLIPQIEASLAQSLHLLLTSENLKSFWQEMIEPRLSSPETRQMIAEKVAAGLKSRAPQFMETLREMVREYVTSFLRRNPLLGGFGLAGSLADGFMGFVNWKEVQEKIEKKLSEPAAIQALGEELVGLGAEFRTWLNQPESEKQFECFRDDLQEKMRAFLVNYLQESLPQWMDRLLESPELWAWIEREMLPAAKDSLESWVQTDGQALVMEKLHLSRRVQEAVEKQDVEEFYQMIVNVAAQHLGAIQVLGFFLGGLVGLVQLLL